MNDSEILDKREQKDFNGITFSNYKKSDVKKQLLNSLINGKIENACYWSIEYICAGHFLDLWDYLLLFAGKNIHLGNPKLPQYLNLRFNNFKDIVLNGYIKNEIKMRNNDKIRKLFAEIISILCLSTKKNELTQVKVNKTDFIIHNISEKLKADSIEYGNTFFKKDDPKEIFIAINEFAYNILITKKTHDCCYWYEWLIDFESTCKKNNKNGIICASRFIAPVDNKLSKDIIWLIWEIILFEASKQSNLILNIVKALLELFSIKYSTGCKKKRRFLIYNALLVTTEISNMKIPIYTDEKKIDLVKKKINVLYKQVKKQEIKPQTDYLFNNSITKKTNLENTIEKLDKMSQVQNMVFRK
tara:strand:- start:524 stop:1597 length:1074 start_codon:yes stop_codon:yes gene_type:complete